MYFESNIFPDVNLINNAKKHKVDNAIVHEIEHIHNAEKKEIYANYKKALSRTIQIPENIQQMWSKSKKPLTIFSSAMTYGCFDSILYVKILKKEQHIKKIFLDGAGSEFGTYMLKYPKSIIQSYWAAIDTDNGNLAFLTTTPIFGFHYMIDLFDNNQKSIVSRRKDSEQSENDFPVCLMLCSGEIDTNQVTFSSFEHLKRIVNDVSQSLEMINTSSLGHRSFSYSHFNTSNNCDYALSKIGEVTASYKTSSNDQKKEIVKYLLKNDILDKDSLVPVPKKDAEGNSGLSLSDVQIPEEQPAQEVQPEQAPIPTDYNVLKTTPIYRHTFPNW